MWEAIKCVIELIHKFYYNAFITRERNTFKLHSIITIDPTMYVDFPDMHVHTSLKRYSYS